MADDIAVKERYIAKDIAGDLKEKMVFIGRPRQVEKRPFPYS